MARSVCLVLLFALVLLPLRADCDEVKDMRRPKKLIATGWDKPDTVRLLENLE